MFATEEATSPHNHYYYYCNNYQFNQQNAWWRKRRTKNINDVGYYRYYRQFCSTNRLTPIKTLRQKMNENVYNSYKKEGISSERERVFVCTWEREFSLNDCDFALFVNSGQYLAAASKLLTITSNTGDLPTEHDIFVSWKE